MNRFRSGTLVALLVLALGCGGGKENEVGGDAFEIGALIPITGTNGEYGVGFRKALELAADEINTSGLLLGKKVEIVVEDYKSDKTLAPGGAQALIARGVAVIIGAAESSSTIEAATKVTIPNNILMVSPWSSSPRLTTLKEDEGKNLLWRTIPSDTLNGKATATYAHGTLKKKSAAIIYVQNPWGEGLAQEFKSTFESLGGAVVVLKPYPELDESGIQAHDYSVEVDPLFSDKPDVIYLVTYPKDGSKVTIAAAKHLTETYQPVFLASDGNRSMDFITNADSKVVKLMKGVASKAYGENYDKYAANHLARYSAKPVDYSEYAYDALYLIAYAALKAKSTVSADIAAQMQAVSEVGEVVGVAAYAEGKSKIEAGTDINYEGASGPCDFDATGDIKDSTYVMWEVKDEQIIETPYQ